MGTVKRTYMGEARGWSAPLPGSTPAAASASLAALMPAVKKKSVEEALADHWTQHKGLNCYDGYGGINVDLARDNETPQIVSVEDAKHVCEKEGYAGFIHEPKAGRVWYLSRILDPSQSGKHSEKYDVYVLKAEKLCLSGHALAFQYVPNEQYICDVCQKRVPKHDPVWGCRQCDYDKCLECASKAMKTVYLPKQYKGIDLLIG